MWGRNKTKYTAEHLTEDGWEPTSPNPVTGEHHWVSSKKKARAMYKNAPSKKHRLLRRRAS